MGHYTYSNRETYKKTIKTFFNKFTPDDRQLKLLLSCYKVYSGTFYWLDVLFNRDCNFTSEQIELIKKSKYNMTNVFLKQGGMKQNDLENILKHWNNDSDNLQKILEKNNTIVTKQAMINYLDNNNNLYYNYKKYKDKYKSIINILFKFGCPPNSDYINILINKKCIGLIKFFSKKHNCKLLKEHLYYTIDKLSWIYWDLFLFFVDTVGPDKKSLDGMLTKYYNHQPSPNNFNNYKIYNGPILSSGKANLLEYIVEKGVEPDKETLYRICDIGMLEYFNIMTDKYKIYPDKKCLDIAVEKSNNIDLIKEILNFKIKPNERTFEILLNCKTDRNELLSLLFDNGLHIDKQMIYKALRYNIILLDLERFGINYDEEFYYYCHKYLTYLPKEYTDGFNKNIDNNILELRNLCKTPNTSLNSINKYMIKNNVIIDRHCLESLFLLNKPLAMIYFKNYGCIPTLNCLYAVNYEGISKRKEIEKLKHELLEYFETKQEFDWRIMAKPYDIDLDALTID